MFFSSFLGGIEIQGHLVDSEIDTLFTILHRMFTARFVSLPLFQHSKISLGFYSSISIEFERYYLNKKCSELGEQKGQSEKVAAQLGKRVVAILLLQVSRKIP